MPTCAFTGHRPQHYSFKDETSRLCHALKNELGIAARKLYDQKRVTPEIGDDCFIIDVCVNDDGIIAMACGEYAYDEEYGEPLSRMCDVFGRYMDGDVLWNYKRNGAMVDYIVPVQGGFLCVSQGLDLYNCPYIGDGWVLMLDENGNVKAKDSTPDIGGGRYEIYGMTKGGSGEAFLYGTLLDDPGFPGAPFVGRLVFPEAYD